MKKFMNLTEKQLHIIAVAVTVIAVMGISAALAILGSNIYKNSAENKSLQDFSDAVGFFTAEMRQCTDFSQVRTASLGGKLPALVLSKSDEASGEVSETWLYSNGGYLMKNVAAVGKNVDPESGERVMPMTTADFRVLEPGLIEITMVMKNGKSHTIALSLANGSGN